MKLTTEEFAAKALIGRRLDAAIQARGLTQARLGAAIHRPLNVISMWK